MSLTLLALAAVLSCPAVDAAETVHVYVNGVLVNGLQGQVLSDVTVTFDEHGDVRIDAPNVKIGRSSTTALAEAPPAQTAAPLSSDVPLGRWWLVASDTGSRGVQIDVRVNGQLVRVVASGEPQLLVDLGPHLHRGPNQLTLTARAQGRPGGDPLKVYVGTGSNQTGVLELGQPQVTFAPTADEVREGVTRVYSVTVD